MRKRQLTEPLDAHQVVNMGLIQGAIDSLFVCLSQGLEYLAHECGALLFAGRGIISVMQGLW